MTQADRIAAIPTPGVGKVWSADLSIRFCYGQIRPWLLHIDRHRAKLNDMSRRTALSLLGAGLWITLVWAFDHFLWDLFVHLLEEKLEVKKAELITKISSIVAPGLVAMFTVWATYQVARWEWGETSQQEPSLESGGQAGSRLHVENAEPSIITKLEVVDLANGESVVKGRFSIKDWRTWVPLGPFTAEPIVKVFRPDGRASRTPEVKAENDGFMVEVNANEMYGEWAFTARGYLVGPKAQIE